MNKNVLVVISGPSGVGKGTIAKMLIERRKDMALSISCTTRAPREGEINGREYIFINKGDFLRKISEDGFLEYSEHFESYYGTPKNFVLDKLESKDVLLEIDVNGGISVKKSYSDAVLIFLVPPSIDELKRRLKKRSTESEDKINMRLSRLDYEMDKKAQYDYVVVNDDLEKCYKAVCQIIDNEKNK